MASKSVATMWVELRGRIERLQQDMDKGVTQLKGLNSKFKSVGSTLGKGIGIAIGAAAVRTVSMSISDGLQRGGAFKAIERGFETLQTKAGQLADQNLGKLRTATQGLVTDFELMRNANQAVQLGLDPSKLDVMAEAATKLGAVVGRTAEESFGDLITGVGRASPLILDNLGITVKAQEAYDKYAASLGKATNQLTENEKAEAFRAVALQKIAEKAQSLAAIQIDASVAAQQFGTAMSNAFNQFAKGLTESDKLAIAFQQLTDALKGVDWARLGENIGDVVGLLMQMANAAGTLAKMLSDAAGVIADFIPGIGYMKMAWEDAADSTTIQRDALESFRDSVIGASNDLNSPQGITASLEKLGRVGEVVQQQLDQVVRELIRLTAETSNFSLGLASLGIAFTDHQAKVRDALNQYDQLSKMKLEVEKRTFNLGQALTEATKPMEKTAVSAGKASDKIKKLGEEWDKLRKAAAEEHLSEQIDKAIDSLNQADFSKWAKVLGDVTRETTMDSLKEGIEAGVIDPKHAENYASLMVEKAIKPINEEWADAQKQAHEESVDTWRGLFENAITGVTFDLESALKQVAVGFAAELANAAFGSLGGGGISSPQALGASLFQGTLGSLFQGAVGSAVGGGAAGGGGGGSLLGTAGAAGAGSLIGSFGTSAASAHAAGIAGPAMAGGGFTSGSGILGALGPWGVGALAVGALAYTFKDDIGKAFGFGGPQDPETKARIELTNQLEEAVRKFGGLKFFDELGNFHNVTNFLKNPVNFNQAGWGEQFGNTPNSGVFNAIGKALGGVLDIGDLPLEQVGVMLSESLGGSLEGLKALMDAMGVSAEQLEAQLLESAKMGEIGWHEFEVSMQNVAKAFEPGLTAVGDFVQAFNNVLESGARGQISINQLKNIIIEAKEAGITGMEELKQKLMESGQFATEDIDGLFQAMQQRGIGSFEDLLSASERTLGGIIADMVSLGVQFKDAEAAIGATVDQLNAIPTNTDKTVNFHFKTTFDSNTQTALNQGAFSEGGITLPDINTSVGGGDATTRSRTRSLSVGSTNINIDARGASPGVEARLRRTMIDLEDRVVNRTMGTIMESSRRGGSIGDSL